MEKIMIKAYIPLDLYNQMIESKKDDSISRYVREAIKSKLAENSNESR